MYDVIMHVGSGVMNKSVICNLRSDFAIVQCPSMICVHCVYSLYAGKQQAADDEDIDDLLNSMNGGGVDADGTGGDDLEVRLAALPADSGDEGSKSKCEYHLVKECNLIETPCASSPCVLFFFNGI